MKKATLLIIMALLLAVTVDAQRSKKRGKKSDSNGYYAISVGPALPLGDFKSDDPLNIDAGFAITGINISLAQFGFKFHPNFGLAGQLMVGANRFDASSFGYTDKDSYWSYGGLMVGPLVSLPIGDQIEFNFRPVVGFMFVATPELNGNEGGVVFKSDQVFALGIDIGATFCYNLNDRTALTLGLDYFTTKPEYKIEEIKFTQQISTFALSPGILFRF